MRRKAWIIRFALALCFSAALDILSTYLVTPDLALEANPLFVMLGRKWVYLITFKIALSLVGLLLFAKSLSLLQSRVDRLAAVTRFANVLSELLFKRQLSLKEFLFHRFPKDWHSVFAVAGITVGTSIILGGFTAGILNAFKIIHSHTQIVLFFLGNAILTIGISLWLTYQFLIKQQKKTKQNPED